MGVPFEALLPYVIMTGMFCVTGVGLSVSARAQNEGKRKRRGLDQWDRQMMERDLRLTGSLRGQTDNPEPPVGFELNKPWKLEKRFT